MQCYINGIAVSLYIYNGAKNIEKSPSFIDILSFILCPSRTVAPSLLRYPRRGWMREGATNGSRCAMWIYRGWELDLWALVEIWIEQKKLFPSVNDQYSRHRQARRDQKFLFFRNVLSYRSSAHLAFVLIVT